MLLKIIFSIVVLSLVVVSCFGYALFEYQNIKLTNLKMETTKTSSDFKIVYLADFQYDLGWKEEYLQEHLFEKVIEKVNKQNPDIILLGGDYLNFVVHTNKVSELLGKLEAPMGVYGVLGNHDYVAKREKNFIEKLKEQGITVLENQQVDLEELSICGVADLWHGNPNISHCQLQDERLNILLTHNPDFFEELTKTEKQQFDLTLAGHLHAGQITFFGLFAFPGIVPSNHGEKYRYGLKNYDDNYIYITSGLGGSVMNEPLRFGAQPEIVVIDVIQSNQDIIKKG